MLSPQKANSELPFLLILTYSDNLITPCLTRPNWVNPLCTGVAPGMSAIEQSALKQEQEE